MEVANARSYNPKRKRGDSSPPLPAANGIPSKDNDSDNFDLSILEAVEKSQKESAVEVLDLRTLKKLVLSFERRYKENIEARLKYPDQPERFADPRSSSTKSSKSSKSSPEGPSFIQTSICRDCRTRTLMRCLLFNSLATIENLIEVKPAVAELVCERTKILRWLLGKIKVREFDSNKQYASEILAILLQNSTANQKKLGQMNGVDVVLQAVAMYKSKDPKSSDEEEMVENLFDCLCCLLMPLENKERFVKAEGVELMIIIMKQKKSAYGSAIRALDFAMTKYPPACERFVDVLGLKTAFAAFMGGILRGSRRDRLLSKFVENECEKIDRLMELYIRYSDRVKVETERMDQLELDDLEIDEEERYNRRLESGLYTLQLIAVILGHLWCSEHSRMRARIELLLKQHKLTREDVKDILQPCFIEFIVPINGRLKSNDDSLSTSLAVSIVVAESI
ncbi:hypothetical protein GH714_014349 [Hevea brasiliensis]|uniref:Beta-catenin-like protein 1 N-terminal domain-containing protein n=1 Tax=Hevea brasiliensis TaxID=3981 RepID=A0A6A6KQQ0_HEVBR|nr:hypothetical protein GH714_014349 [Hevea brasiliensis]